MPADVGLVALTDEQFEKISVLVKGLCGINLHDGKKELVKARLSKRLRILKLGSFREYLDFVHADTTGAEMTSMLDALSTNLTHFFREYKHFEYLREKVLPAVCKRNRASRKLRIWSAGCSSGEEPYSVAVALLEDIADLASWDARVLATDLSTRMLAKAREGLYAEARFRDTPRHLLSKYFHCIRDAGGRIYKTADPVRQLVSFAHLNLMESWPMRGPFDVIFCRNVMIYFDKPTQSRLVQRYWDILAPGGTLFIGHSESLTGTNHRFRYVQPTVYEKP